MRVSLLIRLIGFTSLCSVAGATHAGSPQAAPGERAWVVADVLSLRAAPHTDAPVVGRLRIGSEVQVHARAEPFVEVSLPDPEALRGFVDARFLAEAPIRKHEALSRAERARRRAALDEAIRWAERAAAIDADPRAWRMLAELYAARGDRHRKSRADDVLSGRTPVYLAACRNGRAYVLARHDPERGLAPLAGDVLPEDDLDALSPLLAGALWFSLGAESGPRPLAGTPFPRPEVTVVWNAGHPTLSGGGLALVLGPCPQREEGALYATAPLPRVDERRAGRTKSARRARRHLANALAASLTRPEARALPLEGLERAPARVLVVEALARLRGDPVGLEEPTRVVSVHDARGRLAVTIGGPREVGVRPAGDDVWLALPSGAALGVLAIEHQGPAAASEGYALLLVDEGGPVRMDVMVARASRE